MEQKRTLANENGEGGGGVGMGGGGGGIGGGGKYTQIGSDYKNCCLNSLYH